METETTEAKLDNLEVQAKKLFLAEGEPYTPAWYDVLFEGRGSLGFRQELANILDRWKALCRFDPDGITRWTTKRLDESFKK